MPTAGAEVPSTENATPPNHRHSFHLKTIAKAPVQNEPWPCPWLDSPALKAKSNRPHKAKVTNHPPRWKSLDPHAQSRHEPAPPRGDSLQRPAPRLWLSTNRSFTLTRPSTGSITRHPPPAAAVPACVARLLLRPAACHLLFPRNESTSGKTNGSAPPQSSLRGRECARLVSGDRRQDSAMASIRNFRKTAN